MNCKFCTNYMVELDRCKYCHFEFDEEYNPFKSDDWDILNLDEDGDWEHIQIMNRLHLNGIDCYQADIWYGDNMAYLIGCHENTSTLADVLNMHEEAIYNQTEYGFVVLNLYQEKQLRGESDERQMGNRD